jgi:hypothetical protein
MMGRPPGNGKGWFDRLEQAPQLGASDQSALEHGVHVRAVLIEAALEFGERLRVGVEVPDGEVAHPGHQWASIAPAR